MPQHTYDTVIIGGGVTGLSAAIYAGRLALKTLLLSEKPGGMIIYANSIKNYPGFKEISGFELFKKLEEQAKDQDIEMIEKKAERIEICKDGYFKVFTGPLEHHTTRTIIIATGTEWKKLYVPGEKEFTGIGVHYCALCDGPFYKDKTIAVIGNTDSAAKEALLLAEYGKVVYLISRKQETKDPSNLKKLEDNKKIKLINNTSILKIKGDRFVTGVTLDNPYAGDDELTLDAVFIKLGHTPLSKIAKGIGIKLNEKDEIMIDKESKTNIKGIYAAGDIADTAFKQAITGVGEAVKAAHSAYEYINTTE